MFMNINKQRNLAKFDPHGLLYHSFFSHVVSRLPFSHSPFSRSPSSLEEIVPSSLVKRRREIFLILTRRLLLYDKSIIGRFSSSFCCPRTAGISLGDLFSKINLNRDQRQAATSNFQEITPQQVDMSYFNHSQLGRTEGPKIVFNNPLRPPQPLEHGKCEQLMRINPSIINQENWILDYQYQISDVRELRPPDSKALDVDQMLTIRKQVPAGS
jgi:hypothetical protein